MVVAHRLVTFFILGWSRFFIAGSDFLCFSAGSVRAGWLPLLALADLPPVPSGSVGFKLAGSGATGCCSEDFGRSTIGGA
jgi:hypothetical protein